MSDEHADRHNKAILPIMKLFVAACDTEAEHWILLETIACAIGRLHGRDTKATAEFLDTMTDRITQGHRG